MSNHVARLVAFFVPFLLLVPSCAGVPAATAVTPTVEELGEQATCRPAKDPLHPFIVEWPGTSKVELATSSQHGVVVVSYVGCVLKILAGCRAGGAYETSFVQPERERITVENESDLYAKLPLGVAALKAALKSAGQLDLEYVAVGQRSATTVPTALSGDCRGATHYVNAIIVGAYSLEARGHASGGAEVSVADNGAGGHHEENVRRLRGSGNLSACEQAKAAGCDAILQLGLAPLATPPGGAAVAASEASTAKVAPVVAPSTAQTAAREEATPRRGGEVKPPPQEEVAARPKSGDLNHAPTTDPMGGHFSLAQATAGMPSSGPLVATMRTSKGDLRCKLFDDKAPIAVANFVGLARGIRPFRTTPNSAWVTRPAYDGTTFHRVIKGFMMQGGDPLGTGRGEPGYVFADELWTGPGSKHDRPGLLCMANKGPDTNGIQFFITDAMAAHLDKSYTIFGECQPVSVVHSIGSVPTDAADRPETPVRIEKVEITRGGTL